MKWYQHPLFLSAVVALATAVWVDISAWKSWGDVAFNWKKASFNWCKALFVAILGYYGVGAATAAIAGN